MFNTSFRLPFKLLGIPIKLDFSFLIVLALFTYLIGSQVPAYIAMFGGDRLAGVDPQQFQAGALPYILGFIAAVGLFASVLVHELGHALTGRLYGAETKEITLWFLGGVAQFEDLPRQRGAEAVVAVAGPLTSLLLAGLFWVMAQSLSVGVATLFILSYLTFTNGALAIFNLLPALPLDGGRVLRSLLALQLEFVRATRISVRIGFVVAVLLGLYGLYSRSFFLILIAFFIYNGGRSENRYATVTRRLDNVSVRDLTTPVVSVEPEMSLAQLEQLEAFKRQGGYPVVGTEGQVLGFADSKNSENAGGNTVSAIMTSVEPIQADEEAVTALKRMSATKANQLVVVDAAGKLLGMVRAADLSRTLQNDDAPASERAGAG